MTLDSSVQTGIEKLLLKLDMPGLYRSYKWNKDTWERGFPDLFRLEQETSHTAREYTLSQNHLLQIAQWGRLPNKKRISCQNPINITLYTNGLPAGWLEREPEKAILILEEQIHGFGPTYCSKLLHFAVPQIFGALDTRLVRTFGKGDPNTQRYPLLDLTATMSGGRWAIYSSQAGWPREYGTWTAILNHIAKTLNKNGIQCPYPQQYMQSGLRANGIWLPADVETALFSYASQVLGK